MKLELDIIKIALQESKIEETKQTKVLEFLQDLIKKEEDHKDSNSVPKSKNEFGVILYDANDELKGKEFTASIYSLKQGDDHGTVLNRISEASKEQNEKSKKKKNLITSIGEACEFLKRSFIKQKNINLKTKQTVRVLITNNKLV